MTLRTRIFIIGGLVIGLLLSVGLSLYLFRDKNKKNNLFAPTQNVTDKEAVKPSEESPYKNNNNVGPQNKVIESIAVTNQTLDEVYVKQLAALFVERFDTYSNRNGNAHIEDAIVLSTYEMASWLNSQKITQEGPYRGVTTKVLASDVITLLKEKARVTIGAEETVYQTGAPEISKFRTGLVDLIKIDKEWKVSGFHWEE